MKNLEFLNNRGVVDSNKTEEDISGLQPIGEIYPLIEDNRNTQNDLDQGYDPPSYKDKFIDKQKEKYQQVCAEIDDVNNPRTVTVIGGEGTFGTRVKGDVCSNFGGVTFEDKK